jgi:uncharacterized membrane protein YfcA
VGSYLAARVSETLVRALLSFTLIVVGSKLALEQFHRHVFALASDVH